MNAEHPRIFPLVSANAYDITTEPQGSASLPGMLFVSGANEPFTYLQRFAGVALDSPGYLKRIFIFHKLALRSELMGERTRADFFWRAVHRGLAHVRNDNEFWRKISDYCKSLSPDAILSPERLRKGVLVEWIGDSHAAFYRGSWQSGDQERAETHVGFLKALIQADGIDRQTSEDLLAPIIYERLIFCINSEDYKTALTVGSELVNSYPERLVYRLALARTHYMGALKTLETTPRGHAVAALNTAVAAIESLRLKAPRELCLMEWAADLHNLIAICLINAGRPADALLENAKAFCYNPDLEAARDLQPRLVEELEAFRAAIAAFRASLLFSERLNAAGEGLVRQATTGSQQADEFEQSSSAANLRRDFVVAKSLRLWREVADARPQDDDGIAVLLREKLTAILESDPSCARFNELWPEAVADSPTLQLLDQARLTKFIQHPVWVDSMPHLDSPQIYTPALVPGKGNRGGDAPFQFWLWSPENIWLKVQVVASIVLLFLSLSFSVREHIDRARRERAYQVLSEALRRNDLTVAMDAAETFLESPVIGEDTRESEVKRLYSESLLHWFAEQDSNSEQVQLRLRKFRSLVKTSERGTL